MAKESIKWPRVIVSEKRHRKLSRAAKGNGSIARAAEAQFVKADKCTCQ